MNQTSDRCTTRQGLSDKNLRAQVIALCSINILPTLIAIVGNAVCLIALIKKPSLQTTSNIWVGALCISDLLVGLIIQPSYYVSLVSTITGKGTSDMRWASRNGIILLGTTSFFLAYFVTIDRYIAICHPFCYARVVTKKSCIFGAVLGFLLSIPAIIIDHFAPKVFRYYGAAGTVLIILQIIVFYGRIYATILKQRRHIASVTVVDKQNRAPLRRNSMERRRAYTIGIIIVFMLISYVPNSAIIALFKDAASDHICHMSEKTTVAVAWGKFFVLLNSAINPIIYCFRMQDIRNAIISLFQGKERFRVEGLTSERRTLSYAGNDDASAITSLFRGKERLSVDDLTNDRETLSYAGNDDAMTT